MIDEWWSLIWTNKVKIIVALGCLYYTKNALRTKRLKRKIAIKQRAREENERKLQEIIDQFDATDSTSWNSIIKLPTKILLERLRIGDLKCVDVLRAFQSRALLANKNLNCIVEFLVDAEDVAIQLDRVPKEQRGPLHGLPLSVKECYFVKGCDSTAGLLKFLNVPAKKDCPAVAKMRALGAVPFCLTNVPQSMLSSQCSNAIFGETGNPYNFERECGGSSGGEGSLIGAQGSVIGLGNDIGGSLRIPAAMCGTCSLKPTFGRHLSQIESRSPIEAEMPVPLTVGGFMTRDVDGLITAWEQIWNNPINDHNLAPIPMRKDLLSNNKKLRVGYYSDDGFIPGAIHPGCVRAVEEAAELLKEAGHKVIKIQPIPIDDIVDNYLKLLFCSNGFLYKECLDQDVYDSSTLHIRLLFKLLMLPRFVCRFLGFISSFFSKIPMPEPCSSIEELLFTEVKRKKLMEEFHQMMDEQEIDIVLAPAAIFPAPVKGSHGILTVQTSVHIPWNLLEVPAGIIPFSRVTEEDEKAFETGPITESLIKLIRSRVRGAIGLPLAVQVVSRKFNEELILKTMSELEKMRKSDVLQLSW